MRKKKKRIKKDKFSIMARAIKSYLSTYGWLVVVIGESRIEKKICNPKYKYAFSIDFLGKKIEKDSK